MDCGCGFAAGAACGCSVGAGAWACCEELAAAESDDASVCPKLEPAAGAVAGGVDDVPGCESVAVALAREDGRLPGVAAARDGVADAVAARCCEVLLPVESSGWAAAAASLATLSTVTGAA
jgi:hypothetical protein